jgi:hypothetical protein
MMDDRTNRGAQDRSRISFEEEYEVMYWTKKFGVNRERLAEAIKAAGHSARAAEQYLTTSAVR